LKDITTIQSLLDALASCKTRKDYILVARQLNVPPIAFEPYTHWSDIRYTRNCVERTEEYELLLLCWDKGQRTPIHCHGGEECWVMMLEGSIKEERLEGSHEGFVQLQKAGEEIMQEGDISYMNDDMGFHRLENMHDGRSMTLHLYVKPIDHCRVLNEETGRFQMRDLQYDSLRGELLSEKITSGIFPD